jgi:Cof subfamily protein (haloacid dehalogenase superfamily)
MHKKYIFVDFDGTVIDHSTNSIPESTKEAIKLLQQKGHEVILSTGRGPALFYGVDKQLNIDSYIASNGRYVVYKGEVLYNKYIDKKVVNEITELAYKNKIDIAFSSATDYVLNSKFSNISNNFSDVFHLEYPEVKHNYHLDNEIHQMNLFYNKSDYKKFEELFPTLHFNFSNFYGLDVNEKGGLKEIGIRVFEEKLGIDIEDTIAVGDGHNDISMIMYAHIGISMGNGVEELKKVADIITDDVDKDGFFNVFKKLNLI